MCCMTFEFKIMVIGYCCGVPSVVRGISNWCSLRTAAFYAISLSAVSVLFCV